MADDLCEQVAATVGADVHGEAGTYTAQGGVAVPCVVERTADGDDVFDTGSVDLDFNLIVLLVPKATVPTVKQLGRTGVGDTFVFTGNATVWHARQVLDASKGYYKVMFTDHTGPMDV